MTRFFLALALIISQFAYAGLPPTTSKGVADASNITTFNYNFPSFSVTHGAVSAYIDLSTSGVTAGTYTNATIAVNAKGVITGASSGSAGSSAEAITTTAVGGYQVLTTDYNILVSGTASAVAITPFAVSGNSGHIFCVKNIVNTITTVAPTDSSTIDGDTSFIITGQYPANCFKTDGSKWFVF